jgi:hypothetical protein
VAAHLLSSVHLAAAPVGGGVRRTGMHGTKMHVYLHVTPVAGGSRSSCQAFVDLLQTVETRSDMLLVPLGTWADTSRTLLTPKAYSPAMQPATVLLPAQQGVPPATVDCPLSTHAGQPHPTQHNTAMRWLYPPIETSTPAHLRGVVLDWAWGPVSIKGVTHAWWICEVHISEGCICCRCCLILQQVPVSCMCVGRSQQAAA